jgi:hypothetical protein
MQVERIGYQKVSHNLQQRLKIKRLPSELLGKR